MSIKIKGSFSSHPCIYYKSKLKKNLFFFFFVFIIGNVEVTKFEGLLVSSDNTEPVTDLVLLQELLGEVLEVTLGEGNVSNNSDLVVSRARDSNSFTEVVGTTIDLDTVVEVLFESGSVKDLVVGRTGTVNDELGLLSNSGGGLDGSHVYYNGERGRTKEKRKGLGFYIFKKKKKFLGCDKLRMKTVAWLKSFNLTPESKLEVSLVTRIREYDMHELFPNNMLSYKHAIELRNKNQ